MVLIKQKVNAHLILLHAPHVDSRDPNVQSIALHDPALDLNIPPQHGSTQDGDEIGSTSLQQDTGEDGITFTTTVVTDDGSNEATIVIIGASPETIVVTIVDGISVVTMALTIGGASTMIVTEGRATDWCSTTTCFKDSVKSKIEDTIVDAGTSSKFGRLDNVTYS
ncbi:hypothetical protein SUGI_0491340 [Cryptomeria japonica]|nr:hypothetical protein SUGI_0491340 [Cryptomeria japonica]